MLNQLSRPEEVNIKNDIHEIAKSLATIASSMPNTTIEKTEKKESTVKDGDSFFGKIHMSQEHMDALDKDFNTPWFMSVGLMEECAELQQATSKYYRKYRVTLGHEYCAAEKAAIIEEMAHVLVDIRMVCNGLDIKPGEIQQEIYKKYPEGYAERTEVSE